MPKRVRPERYKHDYSLIYLSGYNYQNVKELATRYGCAERVAVNRAIKLALSHV